MDFKVKGKSWAGNIYHQFESICQDVDDFMSKDTVRFVENQVQNVGTSVKRFYSNVVQDVLPFSEDIVKPEAPSMDGNQVDMSDHVNSVAGIRTKPNCSNEEQLSMNQDSTETLRNSDSSLPVLEPTDADPSEEGKTYLHLTEDDHAVVWTNADYGAEENITRDLVPVTANASFDHEIFPGKSDEDHTSSTHEEGLITIKKEESDYYHQEGKKSFSDDTECVSNISSSGSLSESKSMVEDPNSDEDRSLSAPFVPSADKVSEDNMDSPLPSACDAAQGAGGKDRTLYDSFSTKDESFDVSSSFQPPKFVFSHFSCGEEEEKGVMSSPRPTSPESSNFSNSTSAHFIKKAENISHSHSDSNSCAYDISIPSSTIEAYEPKAVDMLPVFLNLESNDNAFRSDGSDFVVGLFESRHEQQYEDFQSKPAISPSETGNTYRFGVGIDDLNLETVDLSPDEKPDGKSVFLTGNFSHATSHRRRDFGYYKKLIQDAFTSRKRLSKEYKHLSLLYGDIDFGSSQNFELGSLPSSPNTNVNALRTPSSPETCETEWELL